MAADPAPLTPDEAACLACIADHMIPADAALAMPSAADPAIMADMVASLDRDAAATGDLLRLVNAQAGGSLSALDHPAQVKLLTRLRAEMAGPFAVLEAVVSRAYYRDPRVLAALGLEARPPFPAGFAVDGGDFTLLEPVAARGPIWRRA